MRNVKVSDDSREQREHVKRLEQELKNEPGNVALKDHIVRLKVAWGLQQPSQAA